LKEGGGGFIVDPAGIDSVAAMMWMLDHESIDIVCLFVCPPISIAYSQVMRALLSTLDIFSSPILLICEVSWPMLILVSTPQITGDEA